MARVFPVFAAAFAVIYVLAVQMNWALVTYHPRLGEWELWAAPPKSGPAMYWYGWTTTAALGALIFALVATVFPERWTRRLWSGWLWVVPVAAMVACIYLTMPWFRL